MIAGIISIAVATKSNTEHNFLTEIYIHWLTKKTLWNWGQRSERPVYSEYV